MTGEMVLFVVVACVAVCFGWGMRGTTIGGEKGAMLPGAILGLLIAVFSGSELLREQFYMLSAVGAMGMYFGGCMTYGETLSLSMGKKRPERQMAKGLLAVFVKGAIWFGIFGSFVGMYLTASTGKVYRPLDFLVLFVLLPFFAFGGYFLFNKPLDPEKGKFPKIYFSYTRQEAWGGLLGILVMLLIAMVLRGDMFSLKLVLGCSISGAVAWVIGQLGHIYTSIPLKNGKYIFGRFAEQHLIDSWKIMECVLGAIAGIGVSLTICFLQDDMAQIALAHRQNGALWSPIAGYGKLAAWIWVVLLALDMLQFVWKSPKKRSFYDALQRKGLMSAEKYEAAVKRIEEFSPSRAFKTYRLLVDKMEFPLYCVLPIFLAVLGMQEIGMLTSFLVLYMVIVQETAFLHFSFVKGKTILRVITLAFALFIVIAQFFFNWTPDAKLTFLMYGLFYEGITLLWILPRANDERSSDKPAREVGLTKAFGSKVSVHGFFLLCVAAMAVFAIVKL